jgi:hypothetical protein
MKNKKFEFIVTVISLILLIFWFLVVNIIVNTNELKNNSLENTIDYDNESINENTIENTDNIIDNENIINNSTNKEKVNNHLNDYPISHIITLNDKIIFTTYYKELDNENESSWWELKCFEYFAIDFWQNMKTCFSKENTLFNVEELDFNL